MGSPATTPNRPNGRLIVVRSQLSSSTPFVAFAAPGRSHRHGMDRPPGMLRQLHHTRPGAACDFWYVGSHCDIVAVFEGIKHLCEGHGAALVVETAIVGAGASNGLDI